MVARQVCKWLGTMCRESYHLPIVEAGHLGGQQDYKTLLWIWFCSVLLWIIWPWNSTLTVLADYTNGVRRTTTSMEAQSLKRCWQITVVSRAEIQQGMEKRIGEPQKKSNGSDHRSRKCVQEKRFENFGVFRVKNSGEGNFKILNV